MGSVNINVPDLNEVHKKLDMLLRIGKKILTTLEEIRKESKIMTQELVDLEAAVTENTSLDTSIIELVNGLAAQVEALKDDPAKLASLASELRAKSAAMAAAIQANTPAPPPVEPEV